MIPQTLDFTYIFGKHTFHVFFDSRSVDDNNIFCVMMDCFALDLRALKEVEKDIYELLTIQMKWASEKFWYENKKKQDEHFGRMTTLESLTGFWDKLKTTV